MDALEIIFGWIPLSFAIVYFICTNINWRWVGFDRFRNKKKDEDI